MKFSKFQNAIFSTVVENKNNAVVNAGAGSGKSTTAIETVRRFIDSHKNCKSIILSFNKAISEDLKSKTKDLGNNVECPTFHALALRSAKREYGNDISINTDITKSLITTSLKFKVTNVFGEPLNRYKVIKYLNGLTRFLNLVRSEKINFINYTEIEEISEKLYKFITESNENDLGVLPSWDKKEINTYLLILSFVVDELSEIFYYLDYIEMETDFCGLLRKAAKFNLVSKTSKKYDLVVVDEAQDIDPFQLKIIQQLVKEGTTLLIIGDRNQAIYSFRGARAGVMDTLLERYSGVDLDLPLTYRCRKNICNFINYNLDLDRSIIPYFEEDSEVKNFCIDYENKVYNESITDLIIKESPNAVISPTNYIISKLWISLMKKSIPAKLKDKTLITQSTLIIRAYEKKELYELLYFIKEKLNVSINAESEEEKLPERIESCYVFIIEIINEFDITSPLELLKKFNEFSFMELSGDVIELHTVHSSKGLEFDSVVMMYHRFNSDQFDNMLYVGGTRAKTKLINLFQYEFSRSVNNSNRYPYLYLLMKKNKLLDMEESVSNTFFADNKIKDLGVVDLEDIEKYENEEDEDRKTFILYPKSVV